jgi:hypothetical protein
MLTDRNYEFNYKCLYNSVGVVGVLESGSSKGTFEESSV